jgi:molybdate transport system regulatory protein
MTLKLECEIWLDESGRALDARCVRVIQAVERTGSMQKAAAELRVSGCWAWRMVNLSEQRLGFPLLERRTGGGQERGCSLTARCESLLVRYAAAQVEVEALLTDMTTRHFSGQWLFEDEARLD